jgi:hypothetical protein
MIIKQLIEILKTYDPSCKILIAQDEEGNAFYSISEDIGECGTVTNETAIILYPADEDKTVNAYIIDLSKI